MKKWILIAMALIAFNVQAQDLNSLAGSAASSALSGNSMIESLAGDQVKSLTSKLGLTAAQQESVASLVTSQLARPEVQELIGDLSANSLMGGSTAASADQVSQILLGQPDFTSALSGMLTGKQKTKLAEMQKED